MGELWRVFRFVEAFAVHSSEQLEKWVDLLMEGGDKVDAFVLHVIG